MADVHRISLNTATVREQWTLSQAIEGCQRHGIRAITPWRNQVAEMGLAQAARRLSDAQLQVTGLCSGGLFTVPGGQRWNTMIDDNRRAIEEAATLGADCLILVVGGLMPGSTDLESARGLVEDALHELAPYARQAGVPLAIEPLHPMYAADRACINTLGQANDLCDRVGDGVGVVVDVYHVWWDPNLQSEISRAGKDQLLAFHLSDWLVPTTHLALDRGMIGDGVIDLPGISRWMTDSGYEGYFEVELFSTRWWQRDPDEVLTTILTRMNNAI
ncbi:MAG: sugar phosphate isomerase/epimerase family protein [Lysobacterales bacterium]